jgi:hypothetical protein
MKNIGLEDRIIKTLMRRISAGSIVRSFLVFNKFKHKSDSNIKNDKFRIINQPVKLVIGVCPETNAQSKEEKIMPKKKKKRRRT